MGEPMDTSPLGDIGSGHHDNTTMDMSNLANQLPATGPTQQSASSIALSTPHPATQYPPLQQPENPNVYPGPVQQHQGHVEYDQYHADRRYGQGEYDQYHTDRRYGPPQSQHSLSPVNQTPLPQHVLQNLSPNFHGYAQQGPAHESPNQIYAQPVLSQGHQDFLQPGQHNGHHQIHALGDAQTQHQHQAQMPVPNSPSEFACPPPPGFKDVMYLIDPVTKKTFPVNKKDLSPQLLTVFSSAEPHNMSPASGSPSNMGVGQPGDIRCPPTAQRDNSDWQFHQGNQYPSGQMTPTNWSGYHTQDPNEKQVLPDQMGGGNASPVASQQMVGQMISKPGTSHVPSGQPNPPPVMMPQKTEQALGRDHNVSQQLVSSNELKHEGESTCVSYPPESIPDYDLVPETYYRDRFVLAGLPQKLCEDTVTNYVEVVADCTVVNIQLTEDSMSALVTVDQQPDWEMLEKKLSKRPLEGRKLTLSRLPLSDSIFVRNVDRKEESVRLYFENKRSGNTSKVAVKHINTQQGVMVVTFEHLTAVTDVMSKSNHQLSGNSLDIDIWYTNLGLVTEMSRLAREECLELDPGEIKLLRVYTQMENTEDLNNVEFHENLVKIKGTEGEVNKARSTIESMKKRMKRKTIHSSWTKMEYLSREANMEFVLKKLQDKKICGVLVCGEDLELLAVSEDQLGQLEKWISKQLKEESFTWTGPQNKDQLRDLKKFLKEKFSPDTFELDFDSKKKELILVSHLDTFSDMREMIERCIPKPEPKKQLSSSKPVVKKQTSRDETSRKVSRSDSRGGTYPEDLISKKIDVPKDRWRFFKRYWLTEVSKDASVHFSSGELEMSGNIEVVEGTEKIVRDIVFKMSHDILRVTSSSLVQYLASLKRYVEGRERCVIVDKVEDMEEELEGAVGGRKAGAAGGSGHGQVAHGGYGQRRSPKEYGTSVDRDDHGQGHGSHSSYTSKTEGEWKTQGRGHRNRRGRRFVHDSIKIVIKEGEIAKEKADIIVNIVNNTFDIEAGLLSRSIAKGGGEKLKKECREKKHEMKAGSYVTTGGGNLYCSHVFHCCLLPISAVDAAQNFQDQIQQMLHYATVLKAKSISFPALGTGNLKYDPNLVASMMFAAVSDHKKTNPSTCIQELRIVIYNNPVVLKAFRDVEEQSNTHQEASVNPAKSSSGKMCPVLKKGELASEKVDVIVNPTNYNLNLNLGAVSKSLVARGGETIQKECNKKVAKNYLGDWQTAVTDAGDLNCKIYHCNLPIFHKDTNPKFLKNMVIDMLKLAQKHNMKSVAIPALGTGNLDYPRDFVADVLYKATDEFWKDNPKTTLQDIRFVIYHKDHQTYDAFQRASEKYGGTSGQGFPLPDLTPDPTCPPRHGRHQPPVSIGTVKVKVISGDLLEQMDKLEAIVNPISADMSLPFGLSKALANKGGKPFKDNTKKQAGNLKKDKVARVMLNECTVLHLDKTLLMENQKDAIFVALSAADKRDYKTIGIPILKRDDTGEKMAADLYDALSELQNSRPNVVIKEIRVVAQDDVKSAMLRDTLKKLADGGHTSEQRYDGTEARAQISGKKKKITFTIWSDDRKWSLQAKQILEDLTKIPDKQLVVPMMLPASIQKENFALVGANHDTVKITMYKETAEYSVLQMKGTARDLLGAINDFHKCYTEEFDNFEEWRFRGVYEDQPGHRSGNKTGQDLPWSVKNTRDKFEKKSQESEHKFSSKPRTSFRDTDTEHQQNEDYSRANEDGGHSFEFRHSRDEDSDFNRQRRRGREGPDGSEGSSSRTGSISHQSEDSTYGYLNSTKDAVDSPSKSQRRASEDTTGSPTPGAGATPKTSSSASRKATKDASPTMKWFFLDPDTDELVAYEDVISDGIETSYVNGKMSHMLPESQDEVFIVDFKKMMEYPESDESDCVTVLRREVLDTNKDKSLPQVWERMDGKKCNIVPLNGPETEDIQKKIKKTRGNVSVLVVKMERIQNEELYRRYHAKLEQIQKQCREEDGKRNLWFRADSTDCVVSIFSHGFHPSYCQHDETLGDGVYFTTSFEKIVQRDQVGNQYAFLCKVAVGNSTEGRFGVRDPPPSTQSPVCHTLVDDVSSPSTFRISSDAQAYPCVLVTYKVQT